MLPPSRCPECGAPTPPGGCRELFHQVLALEAQVPGGPGEMAHFFAVASYNLQHPSMFTEPALAGLAAALRDAVAGRADAAELRRRAGLLAAGATRVLRRPNDDRPATGPGAELTLDLPAEWPVEWPVTVDSLAFADPRDYRTRARQWAEAVAARLTAAVEPRSPAARDDR